MVMEECQFLAFIETPADCNEFQTSTPKSSFLESLNSPQDNNNFNLKYMKVFFWLSLYPLLWEKTVNRL